MKRRTKRALIFWALLVVLGVLMFVLTALLPMPSWIGILSGLLLWGAMLIWVGLHFALAPDKKKKPSAAFVGNQALYDRISRECNDAVGRYLETVKRKGILKGSALYERPWFLLCGPSKAGKSLLVRGSGLDFPVRYPSEKDGLMIAGANQTTWYFANKAVWIDTPGSFMTEAGADEWRATVAALAKVRPHNPVDGVAVVVGGPEILNADPMGVKQRATSLRSRIDDLIASWGIEFPVYLVFSRMDEVPGFNEFFQAMPGRAHEVFGATLTTEQQKMLPRHAFAQEFQLLCASLSDRRLEVLSADRDASRKRLICRFAIHFEGIQEKLADFVSELFKPTSYEGKPLFQGFYFTACRESADEKTVQPEPSIDVSQTIAGHPLNPRRLKIGQTTGAAPAKSTAVRSFFVGPLFSEVMSGDKSLVKRTQKRSRREMIRHYGLAAAIALAALVAAGYFYSSMQRSNTLLESMASKLSQGGKVVSYADAYRRFGSLGTVVGTLQRYKDGGVPLPMGGGLYRGGRVLEELRPEFFAMADKLIVKPSVRYLEYRINQYCDEMGELSGESHLGLYRALKAYLSLSEAIAERREVIDTTFLRSALIDAVTHTLLRSEGQTRLPKDIETVLQENMGVFLVYHKRGNSPLIQENQNLVKQARRRLQRLPDAATLYETVANRMTQDVPQISLGDILGSTDAGILRSELTISAVYTQEGLERYVRDAIAEASKDPFKVDWVIGLIKGDMSVAVPDAKKLREGMTEAYFTDYTEKWIGFLGAVTMEPFGDLARCGRMLKKLVGDQSELMMLLEAVGEYTTIREEEGGTGEKVMAAASKVKATKKFARQAEKAKQAAPEFSFRRKSGHEYLTKTFDPLRSFVKSSGGALGGYEGYRDRILSLSEKLSDIEERGEDHAVAVFNGTDDDALLAAWKFTQNTVAGMPDELGQALGNVLLQPITHTGWAASNVLTERLNLRWQDEVVRPFTSRFTGSYPFNSNATETSSFTDVMDFFRPSTGTFWGFYTRVLAPFVVKNGSEWTIVTVGSLTLSFNPAVTTALKNAERIRDIFFKPDGTVRSLSITLTPLARNKYTATLSVCGQEVQLTPGGSSATIRWPVDAPTQDATLKVQVGENFTQDISFRGRWGLMQLLQKARVNVLGQSSFDATWEMNVQNMYMAYLTYRIQVAGGDHPFGDPVFAGFDCPTNLTVAQAHTPQGQASGAQDVE